MIAEARRPGVHEGLGKVVERRYPADTRKLGLGWPIRNIEPIGARMLDLLQ